ncbi:MAG: hypothetical protein V3T08_07735 [Gemmatimonadota bacterium]
MEKELAEACARYLAELFAPKDLRFTSIIVPTRGGVAAAILNQG